MSWRLSAEEAGLLVVDAQEKLVAAVAEPTDWVKKLTILVEGAKILGLPICITEQVPSKLGKTMPVILKAAGNGCKPVAKTFFSAVDQGKSLGKKRILVAGCEAHVCLLQTALALLEDEFEVWVVTDACSSRTERNRDAAFDRLAGAGAELLTTEMVAFEWLRHADHPQFRAVQALIK